MSKLGYVIELLNKNKSYYFVDFSGDDDSLLWTSNILNAYQFPQELDAAEFIIEYIEPRQTAIIKLTEQLIKDRLQWNQQC